MTDKNQSADFSLGFTRRSLEGTIVRACRSCQAPGLYSSADSIKDGWPACYDPKRNGQPVGDVCPQCGALRPANEFRGELSANIPKFVWLMILGLKWCIVRWKNLTQRKELTQ